MSNKPKVTNEDIERTLYELYRAITSPYNIDNDAILETARYQLIERGHDVDTWPEPPKMGR